jgi:hypothetical protein
MRNAQCRNYNLVRKLNNIENEKDTLRTWNMERKSENLKNEKYTVYDLDYG